MRAGRRVAVPLWGLGALLVCSGVAIGIAVAFALGSSDSEQASITVDESRVVATTTTNSTTSSSTTTTSAPTTTATTTTTVPVTAAPTTTTLPEPRGSMRLLDFYGGASVEPACQQWDVLLVNNSNVEVVELRFHYETYLYRTLDDYDPEAQKYPPDQPAEYPGPTVQPVAIPPGVDQAITTVTCTSTPVPTSANGYELSTSRPIITWVWQGGRSGTLRF